MSGKNARPTDEDLLAQLGALGGEEDIPPKGFKTTIKGADTATAATPDADLFPELAIPERQRPTSRPHTPRLPSSTTTQSSKASPRRGGINTPPSNDGARSSEEKPATTRKSGESSRSFHKSMTPRTDNEADMQETEKRASHSPEPAQAQASGGGGWWGGIFATASAAVKQAEALAKEIQRNEEAQRWAEQVKGNVGALRGFGGELRSRALPTFTNILHTLAPPISSHERLQIHITHDIVGYPSLDPLIYTTFSRVMSQVEGGDLMVIQRGQESSKRRSSDAGYTGGGISSSGWSDGPWWRQSSGPARNLGAVKGLVEGTKLSKVSAESYASEYYASRGGLEQAAREATEVLSESNPTRRSDIFLAIQAVNFEEDKNLFGEPAAGLKEGAEAGGGAVVDVEETQESVAFAIYLHDPIHGITFSTLSQSVPRKWIDWLDSSSASLSSPLSPHIAASPASPTAAESHLPDDIREIVESGGVDPREWVAEWVEELLALGVGVVAQRYVARRMGVGLGGLGRGKGRAEAVESGGGEAARAV